MQGHKIVLIFIILVIVGFFSWAFFYEKLFTEEYVEFTLPHADLIKVSTPKQNSLITSPLSVEGEARGQWYFEATFPVKLLDEDGSVLVEHYATAEGEWMTENFVPFKATLNFPTPKGNTGTLIISNSNASGLPEYDKSIEIPVRFK